MEIMQIKTMYKTLWPRFFIFATHCTYTFPFSIHLNLPNRKDLKPAQLILELSNKVLSGGKGQLQCIPSINALQLLTQPPPARPSRPMKSTIKRARALVALDSNICEPPVKEHINMALQQVIIQLSLLGLNPETSSTIAPQEHFRCSGSISSAPAFFQGQLWVDCKSQQYPVLQK